VCPAAEAGDDDVVGDAVVAPRIGNNFRPVKFSICSYVLLLRLRAVSALTRSASRKCL